MHVYAPYVGVQGVQVKIFLHTHTLSTQTQTHPYPHARAPKLTHSRIGPALKMGMIWVL